VDYKALIGDPSDNIPGVAGIGPKSAASLLNQFGTLENIYADLNKIENLKVREN
jgi:DNA polymerase-1